jgi:alpha-D-ribose 1-methylphosphonate 5-triphosphate synthase subunit PhnH
MSDIAAGFSDPVLAAQAVFRAVLTAMAHPGRLVKPAPLPPAAPGLDAVTTAILLTLADLDTPVWLDAGASPAAEHLRFHCGCRIVRDPGAATFGVITDAAAAPPLTAFALGSDEAPETAATLIITVAGLAADGALTLSGPGIDGTCPIGIAGLNEGFRSARAALTALFPRGLDLLLTDGTRLIGLPRTTRIEG